MHAADQQQQPEHGCILPMALVAQHEELAT